MKRLILLTVMAAAIFSSCSVINDRSKGPCLVVFDFSSVISSTGLENMRGGIMYMSAFRSSDSSRIGVDTLQFPPSDNFYKFFVERDEKTEISIILVKRGSNHKIGVSDTHLPAGEQPDSIYAFHTTVNTYTDQVDVPVFFHKQFSTIKVVSRLSRPASDVTLTVVGQCDGLDLRTLDGAKGNYTVIPHLSDKEWVFRIPRQSSPVLNLMVEDVSGKTDEFVGVIDLAKSLQEVGYDFKAEDMEDMEVRLSLSDGKFCPEIVEWNGTQDINREY